MITVCVATSNITIHTVWNTFLMCFIPAWITVLIQTSLSHGCNAHCSAILPVPLYYATSLIMARSHSEFGVSSETPSPAVARPFAITVSWHSHRQLPHLPWAPPLASQMLSNTVCVCGGGVLTHVSKCTCPHPSSFRGYICGVACCCIWNSLPCVNG